jgi:hypothetical protein
MSDWPRSSTVSSQPCTQGPGEPLRGLRSFGTKPPTAANRFGIDLREAASSLGDPICPILDIHAHINGERASVIWWQVARVFGVSEVYSQVRVQDCDLVRRAVEGAGGKISFIGFPEFRHPDRRWAWSEGYVEHIAQFQRDQGAKVIKLWNAPRMFELFEGEAGRDIIAFDSHWRVRQAEAAQALKMGIMVHVADPDTWFATKYKDEAKYRAKREHYPALERMMDRFAGPWLAAHMGGFPEDLAFLDGLLTRHPNLYLDTSATKWIVRELSRHPRQQVREFFLKWQGRILFGSDIVTVDDHLAPTKEEPGKPKHPMADLADSPASAFDLYASRYLALRLLFETQYEGESGIADPDLLMTNPGLDAGLHAPRLQGIGLPNQALTVLYRGAAEAFLARCG